MIKSVAGIIFINNKYLFQVRDKKSSIWFPGFNGFFGGLVDKNETPNHAIKREIREALSDKLIVHNNRANDWMHRQNFDHAMKVINPYRQQ